MTDTGSTKPGERYRLEPEQSVTARPSALSLYLTATAAVEPAVVAWASLRARGERACERERLGKPLQPPPPGDLLWLHGASVGESLSLLPLLREILRFRGDLNLLVSSRTRTSAAVLKGRLPAGVVRTYAPLDLPGCLRRFLCAWKPQALVLAESEIWPGLLSRCHESGVPVALINARMSDRSVRNWRRFPDMARSLLDPVRIIEAQDAETARRLVELGARSDAVAAVGSLKAAGEPLPANPAEVDMVRNTFTGSLAWLAASTHEADESIVLDAHARVLERCPGASLVMVPRHPNRGREIAASVEARGWTVARRSTGEALERGRRVYVADTLGELGLWYRALPVAFIGGSFGGIGGHNPYEPAVLGCAILHGGDVGNFRDIYGALDRGGGALPVRDASGLSESLLHLMDCKGRPAGDELARLLGCAEDIARPKAGQAERLARRILGLVEPPEALSGAAG